VNGDTHQSFESPLEAVLSEAPSEQPPADLKQRCLQAIHDAEAARAPRRPAVWPIVWKSATGLAAAFAVLVAAVALLPPKKAMMSPDEARPTARPMAKDQMQTALAQGEEESEARMETDVEHTGDARSGDAFRLAKAGPTGGGMMGGTGMSGPAAAPIPSADNRVDAAEAADSIYAPITRKVDSLGDAGPADRPWRDESGERQKVTRKDMRVAVDDIEDAHERAASIITQVDGYVDTEDMEINERGEGQAVLTARVPVDALDGVIAQLRELGKVLELRGESEDRTNEYYSRGQSIRELAEREMQLVAKYEAETNRSRKQQLLWEIQSLRQQIRAQKAPLKALSSETHFAFLTLTLTQAEGPRQFLHRLAGSVPTAAAWLAISAIFWVPVLLVVVFIWRRATARQGNGNG